MTATLVLAMVLGGGLVVHGAPPHIIFMLADDLGWNDVSFHGSPQIRTPNIDHLASQGLALNNYYVQPLCTPSRGALMTGKYPIRTGLQHNVIYPSSPWGLPLNQTILPQHFKKLGYTTRGVGKWHLGFFNDNYLPTRRGFDSFYGFWAGGQDYYLHMVDDENGMGLDFRDNLTPVTWELGNYSTEIFSRESVRIIGNHDPDQPLFLYLAYQSPHSSYGVDPLEAPSKYVNRFRHIKDPNRRVYAGMVSAMDDSVGDILQALGRKGMLENSIIVFSSDNGGVPEGLENSAGSNWPLRGTKYTLWEGGIRVSGLMWSPLIRRPSRKAHQLMHMVDWLPTLYSAAGGNVSDLEDLDGQDLWESLSQDTDSPRKEILLNIDPIWGMRALRTGPYKVISGDYEGGRYSGWYGPSGSRDTSHYDVECGPRLYPSPPCNPSSFPCLFNVELDPCEQNNLVFTEPRILQQMLFRLAQYDRTQMNPLFRPDDPKAAPKYHNFVWSPWKADPLL